MFDLQPHLGWNWCIFTNTGCCNNISGSPSGVESCGADVGVDISLEFCSAACWLIESSDSSDDVTDWSGLSSGSSMLESVEGNSGSASRVCSVSLNAASGKTMSSLSIRFVSTFEGNDDTTAYRHKEICKMKIDIYYQLIFIIESGEKLFLWKRELCPNKTKQENCWKNEKGKIINTIKSKGDGILSKYARSDKIKSTMSWCKQSTKTNFYHEDLTLFICNCVTAIVHTNYDEFTIAFISVLKKSIWVSFHIWKNAEISLSASFFSLQIIYSCVWAWLKMRIIHFKNIFFDLLKQCYN